jgi:hypothetical protein
LAEDSLSLAKLAKEKLGKGAKGVARYPPSAPASWRLATNNLCALGEKNAVRPMPDRA